MSIFKGMEPERVLAFFEQIASIPHGSGNTREISDYVVSLARKWGLTYKQDEFHNVIVWKEGQGPGREQVPGVILQGHLDMVCEKEEDVEIDFEKEGLTLELKGDTLTAQGTTLGGDDGIAVAFMLAILEDKTLVHPPLECVFTVDEEVGMLGAAAMDMSVLKSKRLLNIDSEDEGIFLLGCAGGVTAEVCIPAWPQDQEKDGYVLEVSGLKGGHSGTEIDKGRGNASVLLGRVLAEIDRVCPLDLGEISGGLKDNAIPRSARAVIYPRLPIVRDVILGRIKRVEEKIQREYRVTDPDVKIQITGTQKGVPFRPENTAAILLALRMLPNGIRRMSFDIPGLVQTSLNLGIMKTTDFGVSLSYSVRSSVESEKNDLVSQLTEMAEYLGGEVKLSGAYPAWEYKEDSQLAQVMKDVFRQQYGKDPITETIHAGVECGLFAGNIQGLDAVSFGPDMKDIHTPKESMDLKSVKRTWDFLLKTLESLK